MRKLFLLSTLFLMLGITGKLAAQDFSNKGKEFWLAYSFHVGMVNSGGSPVMTLYLSSDVTTTYSVDIFNTAPVASGTINAGQVVTVNIPSTYFVSTQGTLTNRGIHVTAAKPIVVYSYITRNAASAATLCLPATVLGREYVSMNYKQISNENNSNSFVTVVAAEDNTSVEVTPSGNTTDPTWVAGAMRVIKLNKGDVFQLLGALNGNTGDDLTGTTIKSVAGAGTGCKKIAVFSGSGKISIGCGSPGSSDNLYQQLYPVASWGKKYLTIPSYNRPNAIYRVMKSVSASNVYLNGALIPAASFTSNYYEFSNNLPNKIESDQPISVAQYFTTQGCAGNGNPYDPDMIMLNPVEQNIDKVTLVSSSLVATGSRQHHVHVIIKNAGTALSSFKLDGNPVPAGSWSVHTGDPAFSYIYLSNLQQGYHTLASDSGFNALAYGYADAETYGYSAGSNIKDLYQFLSTANQYAAVDIPATCKDLPFQLSMTFPYQPTQIVWQLNGLAPDVTDNSPVFTSSSVVNGRTIYKYTLPNLFTIATAGSYPIHITAQNPTADGCNGEQEIDYELQVYNPPVAEFNFSTNGCVSTPVAFTDNSVNSSGRPISKWHWNFGDNTVLNGNGANSGTTHLFAGPGAYNVKYTVITDVGCKSVDTAQHVVTLNQPPVAAFTIVAPYCSGKTITFKNTSTVTGGATIVKWIWNFGDGSPTVTATTGADQTHVYTNPGTYNVTLQVESNSGCLSAVTPFSLVINPDPVVNFNLPSVCLPAGAAQFNSASTISDGTQNLFTYLWNFGDAATSAQANPVHNYTAAGPFTVSLTVTSNNGCIATKTQTLSTVFAEPQAAFTVPAEVCLGNSITFSDQSTAPGSTITQWAWDFGDGTTSTDKNPLKTYTLAGSYTVTLKSTSAVGCATVSPTNIATRTVIVNKLPTVDFIASLPGCVDQDVIFTSTSIANAGNIVKYNWNFGDATNTVRSDALPFTHAYSAVNLYTVSLQVETDKGCISTVLPRPLQINPVPVAAFTPPDICVNDLNVPFIEASTIATGSITGWEWNFGDASLSGAGNPNTSNIKSPAHHYTMPGNYDVRLIAISNLGCRDTLQKTFTVNGGILTPQFNVQATGDICSNKEVVIQDASRIDAGSILRVEIFWDQNDLTIKTVDANPVAGKMYTHTYPEFATPATKTYRVRYDIYSGVVCVNTFYKDITLLSTPSITFDPGPAVCTNAPSFQITPQLLTPAPGSGVFSGAGVSASGLFDPAAAGAGTRTIVYTYSGTNGCSNSLAKTIVVNPTPIADAGPDKVVLEGGLVVLTPKEITNIPVTYLWSPATWLNNPNIAKASSSPLTDFTYTLTVTSDKGCTTDDDVFVKLLKTPVIPNIFSPNGDGIHDRWEIEYLESYPGCVIQLFNRYGQKVYQITNYTTPWDGKINGTDAPVGTYYYVIDPKNGRKPMTGYVDIIR